MLINSNRGNVPPLVDGQTPSPQNSGDEAANEPPKAPGDGGKLHAAAATGPSPGTPAFAAHKAKRAEVKAAFERARAADGTWGNEAARSISPKSKLTANPYAPSFATLQRVATQADAGPVLPPPAGHIKAIQGAQAKAMAKRMDLPSHATTLGTAAAGFGVAVPTAAVIQAALADPNGQQKEAFTAEEGAQIKALIGRAPPAEAMAAAVKPVPATAQQPASATDATGTAHLSDSLESLQLRAKQFVPWQAFAVTLSAKEVKALGQWLLLRQKIQHLSAMVSVQTLKMDVQHQQAIIAVEQATTVIGFVRAFGSLQQAPLLGIQKQLINAGLNTDPDDNDLSTGVNQNNDKAPAQDLHRMALIRQAAGEKTTVSPGNSQHVGHHDTAFNAYVTQDMNDLHHADHKIMLRAPARKDAEDKNDVLVPRTLLTDEEVASLHPHLQAAYSKAISEMNNQRSNDLCALVGLYDHEAGLCASAAARCPQGDDKRAWQERAAFFADKADGHRVRMQHVAHTVMRDENRYGDLTRERSGLESKRNGISKTLNDGGTTLSPETRLRLQRKKLNLDWRATYLDAQLGRYSNPSEDNRMSRWHTGAAHLADGFIQNHLTHKQQAADRAAGRTPHADQVQAAEHTSNTLLAVAPVG